MTVPMLKRLLLKRFRSIHTADMEFANPTFMVGRNGSGKSNIADAFTFLAEAMTSPLPAVIDRRGGIATVRNRSSARSRGPELGLGIELTGLNDEVTSAHYALELKMLNEYWFEVVREQCIVERTEGERDWFDRISSDTFKSSVEGLNPALEKDALVFPLVGGDTRFRPVHRFLSDMRVYRIEPSALREMQDPDEGLRLRSDGGNAASVLRQIGLRSEESERIISRLLKHIVPNTVLTIPKKHGNKLSLEFVQRWGKSGRVNFEGYSMSDGTLRAVGILVAVFQVSAPSVLVIEGPESTIHPGALGAILDLLQHAGYFMQVVVTTHSPDILDAKWIEERHLKIVNWKRGKTDVGSISDGARRALQEHLMGAGELLRSNVLMPASSRLSAGRPDAIRLFQDGLK